MTATFDQNRVGIVDTHQDNILIRGNYPLHGTTWAYGVLSKALAPAYDLTKFDLIDIAILDNTGENTELTQERATFDESAAAAPLAVPYPPYDHEKTWNPLLLYGTQLTTTDTGQSYPARFGWWPFEAQAASIPPADPSWKPFLLPDGGTPLTPPAFYQVGYGFAAAVRYLRTLMQTPQARPVAIYFHCTEGTDRTGALAAGYILHQQPDLSVADAIAHATALIKANIPPSDNYRALVAAYWTYMNQA